MENRDDLLKKKKLEVMSFVREVCVAQYGSDLCSTEIMDSLFDNSGLFITAPQQEPPMMHMLTMDSLKDFHKGESIKPGNIKLNIRNVIGSLPEMTAACVEIALDIPILKVCAALNIWKMLRDLTTIEITKEQAIIVVALWENCDRDQRITLEKGFDYVNTLCRNMETPEFTWEKYINVISDLEKLSSIELDSEGIWLREWVSKKYTR